MPSAPTLPPFTLQLFLDLFKERPVKGMIYLDNAVIWPGKKAKTLLGKKDHQEAFLVNKHPYSSR